MTAEESTTLRALLTNLAAELARQAAVVDDAQEAVADITAASSPGARDAAIVRLQSLDSLSQILKGLERLAQSLAPSRIGSISISRSAIDGAVRLPSLAGRLTSRTEEARGDSDVTFFA